MSTNQPQPPFNPQGPNSYGTPPAGNQFAPPAPSGQDRKRQAREAKATANANSSWFSRHKILTGIGVLMVVGVIASFMNPGSDTATPVAKQTSAGATTTTAGATAATTAAVKPATTAPPATAAAVAKIGTPVTVGDFTLTVNSVSDTKELKSVFGNKKGNWKIVTVTVANNGKDQATLDSSQFTLIEADGTEYGTDSDNIMYMDSDKSIFYKQLNPKLSLQGQTLFAVPATVGELTLKFDAGLFGPSTKIALIK